MADAGLCSWPPCVSQKDETSVDSPTDCFCPAPSSWLTFPHRYSSNKTNTAEHRVPASSLHSLWTWWSAYPLPRAHKASLALTFLLCLSRAARVSSTRSPAHRHGGTPRWLQRTAAQVTPSDGGQGPRIPNHRRAGRLGSRLPPPSLRRRAEPLRGGGGGAGRPGGGSQCAGTVRAALRAVHNTRCLGPARRRAEMGPGRESRS